MTSNLNISVIQKNLIFDKPIYTSMLANIEANFPAISQNASNFYKGHSQFMNVTLDVTTLTPLRSMYQTLAEIEKTKSALQEAHINLRKKDIEVRRKEAQLTTTEDVFDKELLEVEIIDLRSQAASSKNYVEGAIRKLNFFVNQHNSLLATMGKETITEEDYEREEVKYHIMTCMKQSLNAARSRGGIIDEGNMIYLFDLGINAAQAQTEVFAYLNMENELLSNGEAPTHEMTVRWLESCAEKWASNPIRFAQSRGFIVLDKDSLTNLPVLEAA
jgi:hypothetical protein